MAINQPLEPREPSFTVSRIDAVKEVKASWMTLKHGNMLIDHHVVWQFTFHFISKVWDEQYSTLDIGGTHLFDKSIPIMILVLRPDELLEPIERHPATRRFHTVKTIPRQTTENRVWYISRRSKMAVTINHFSVEASVTGQSRIFTINSAVLVNKIRFHSSSILPFRRSSERTKCRRLPTQ